MRLTNPVGPPIRGPLHNVFTDVSRYPLDAILHYDANLDAFSEQTGGVHSFQHAVLSPQYQRNADGSYSNVGAKPAVDVFDGEKWLRSCGAVTNLHPYSNTGEGAWTTHITTPAPTYNAGIAPDGTNTAWTFAIGSTSYVQRNFSIANDSLSHTWSICVKPLVSGAQVKLYIGIHELNALNGNYDCDSGEMTQALPTGVVFSKDDLGNGWKRLNFTFPNNSSGKTIFISAIQPGSLTNEKVLFWGVQLTKSAYPLPYIPTTSAAVTQPASNATTTNGSWFALPDGSPLWQALTGQPLTLATRVRMGVESGDLPNNTTVRVLDVNATSIRMLYVQLWGGVASAAIASDGTSFAGVPNTPWQRNAIVRQVLQVNTAGTQFRTGCLIEGAHTEIQWRTTWMNFDGSFDPSILYRLMLGYVNAYPMWFNKITAWRKQVSDAEILEAMA